MVCDHVMFVYICSVSILCVLITGTAGESGRVILGGVLRTYLAFSEALRHRVNHVANVDLADCCNVFEMYTANSVKNVILCNAINYLACDVLAPFPWATQLE